MASAIDSVDEIIPVTEDDEQQEQEPGEDPAKDEDVEAQGGLCRPDGFLYRSAGLILMCLLGFGSYFCFDNPGALQNEIKVTMKISTFEFANLYSLYSWPNVVFPVIGGYLIDAVFGLRSVF